MDSAQGIEQREDYLASRVLLVNFASVHTTSITFTQAIYDLAAHPELIPPLREEIETLVALEGWQKSTVMKMHKLDSCLKESIRMHPLSQTGSGRKTLKPFTFSNGVTVPEGVTVVAPIEQIHMDPSIYENADKFDGFRFNRLRERDGNAKYQAVNVNNEYLHFGNGQHACPGRFFAVNEIKLMLAFTLLRFDFRTKDGVRPRDGCFQTANFPNMKAEILFKKSS